MRPFLLFLYALLGISLVAFGLDLIHMIYHLYEAPHLWQIQGVPLKLALKWVCFLSPLILFIFRKQWIRLLVLYLLIFNFVVPAYAESGCQHARELLSKSGIARNANENWRGQVKVDPPTGSFPTDMNQITWWGEFQPFEFWESPEFQAVWINPEGQEVQRRSFRGERCSLGKTSIFGAQQPRGEFQAGMWSVLITCQDYLIDKQSFAVLPSGGPTRSSQDIKSKQQETAMIWAKDALKE